MPRYIIERDVPVLSQEELAAAGKKSVEVIASMNEDIVWVKSYVSSEGKFYCEYDAPNPEAILEHARRVGVPVTKISEVSLEINPAMFQ